MALAVETSERATLVWEQRFAYPLALVFGNEALGVEPDTLAACDGVVCLPMLGRKASINVGNCAAVALYAVVAQWLAARRPGAGAGLSQNA